jgi:hypothetical protein
MRHWYGKWNFGAGSLIVGKTWTPTFQSLSDSNLSDMWVTGLGDMCFSLRQPGLQVWMDVGGGSLRMAALNVTVDGSGIADVGDASVATNDTDTTLPRLEVSYAHKIGPVDATFFGGYQTFDVEANSAAYTASSSVDSYVLGGTAIFNLQPAYIKAGVYIGQNLYDAGMIVMGYNAESYLPVGGTTYDVANADDFGWQLTVGFAANDQVELQAGWGHVESEIEVLTSKSITEQDVYYIMAMIKLADNVYIYPEIARSDYGEEKVTSGGTTTTTDLGTRTTYGIYWRINF